MEIKLEGKRFSATHMEKSTFINNFRLLLIHLDNLTQELSVNKLSTNYTFILEPSDRSTSNHLTTEENEYLKSWNKLLDKQLTFDQVVELLFKDGKTPKWADCSVYYSTADLTVVKILFSRQFRDEKEIYYMGRGTGPFKPVVATPHYYTNKGAKFDVNWKKHLDDKKRGGLWKKVRRLLNI